MRFLRASLPLVAALALGACGDSSGPEAAGGNVVIVSIDTLRSDRLPAYGYDAIETPAFDALAGDAILFERAYSHYPLTLPAHASLFTGLLPPEHGVRNNKGYALEDDLTTLAERFAAAGYDTAGFASSMVLRRSTGVAQGFGVWDAPERPEDAGDRRFAQRSGEVAVERALEWLGARESDSPFLLFVHLFEPHTPYEPPEPFRSRYESPYDGEVAYTDTLVGRLIEGLKRAGAYDDSTLLLLSDHGEGLGDHVEPEHGLLLYREALQVPLLLKLPASERGGTRVARPVGLFDVAPTLLELAGLEGPGLPGVPLLAGDVPARRNIYAETLFGLEQHGFAEMRSVIADADHYIHSPRPELFDLAADPEQRNNLLPNRQVPAPMAQAVIEVGEGRRSTQQVSPEEEQTLAALGYLGGPGGPVEKDADRPDVKDHIHEIAEMWRLMDELGEATEPETALRLAELVKILNVRQEPLSRNIATNLLLHGLVEPASAALEGFSESTQTDTILLLGEIDTARGRLGQAGARFERVLAMEPNNPRAHRNVGILLLTQGRVAAARGPLERAVQLDADEAPAWNGLGVVHVQSGDLENAVLAWQRAVAADPELSDAWFNLAVTQRRLGRSRQAAEALERYIPLARGEERRRAEALLRELRG